MSFRYRGHRIATGILGVGPPLVMVHGTPFSKFVWRGIAPALAARYRVHLFDLLGYGASEMPEDDVSLGVQNGLLAALLREWGLTGDDAPFVLAHDFGAATALRAHLLDGCDYRALLLFDAVAIRPWGSPFVQHVRQHEAAFAGVPDYMHEAMLGAYLQGAAARPLSAEALEGYAAPWRGPVGKPAFYRQIAQMDAKWTNDIEPRLAEMRCPVHVLWGEADSWIPIADGRRFAAMLPDTALQPVAGAGHLVQEDAPEEIIAAALGFFR